MNRLDPAKQAQVVAALVEGNSIRATVRMTGVAKNTIAKLVIALGAACSKYQDEHFRNLKCKNIQVDEIWSFVYAKEKDVPPELRGQFGVGSVWTWVAIDSSTKLVPSWMVGTRDPGTATAFLQELAGRLAYRVQLTSDGHRSYLTAVPDAFGEDIDFAMLVKLYGPDPEVEKRYSPSICLGCMKTVISGDPDPDRVSTSYVERQNLTIRMSVRRFTRLTNAFSKKIENHIAALSIHYMHYNFCRIHQTLRVTPTMEAGISDHVWSIEELIQLLD